MNILISPAEENLLASPAEATEHNLAELLRYCGRLPDIELHDDDDAVWSLSSSVSQMNHLVMPRFRKESVEDRIEQIADRYR